MTAGYVYAIDGGDTELLAAAEYSAIQIPDDMSFEDAAATPRAGPPR